MFSGTKGLNFLLFSEVFKGLWALIIRVPEVSEVLSLK
jgi:hypothetical protein